MRIWLCEECEESNAYLSSDGDESLKNILNSYKNFCEMSDLPENGLTVLKTIKKIEEIKEHPERFSDIRIVPSEVKYYLQLMKAVNTECTQEVFKMGVKNKISIEEYNALVDKVLFEKMALIKTNRLHLRDTLVHNKPTELMRMLIQPIQLAHIFLPSCLTANQK